VDYNRIIAIVEKFMADSHGPHTVPYQLKPALIHMLRDTVAEATAGLKQKFYERGRADEKAAQEIDRSLLGGDF